MFLHVEEFKLKYPFGNQIYQGGYGSVYSSENSVVKIQNTAESQVNDDEGIAFASSILASSIREIDFYSRISHPCIVSLLDWSIEILSEDEFISYMAFPKGEDINSAYKNGKITFDEICQDLLSAVAFLHSNYICHKDIKPYNIIFIDGRAVLIDFGISKNTKPVDDYAITKGIGFTPTFRDPEYVRTEDNKDTCDEYSLGVALYCILHNLSYIKDGINDTEPYPYIIGYNLEDDGVEIIKDCFLPIGRRLRAIDLLKKYEYEYIPGTIFETEIPTYGDMCTDQVQQIFNKYSDWMFGVCMQYKYDTKTFFLVSHLFHRSLKLVVPNFVTDQKDIELLCICCIYLASISEEDKVGIDAIMDLSRNYYNMEEFLNMIKVIMIELHGIVVTETYWFYAKSCDDIFGYLTEVFSCNYNLDRIKFYTVISVTNKDMTCDKIMFWARTFYGVRIAQYAFSKSISSLKKVLVPQPEDYIKNQRIVIGVKPKADDDPTLIEKDIVKIVLDIKSEYIGVDILNYITSYMKYFKQFTPENGYQIYNALINWKITQIRLMWYYNVYLGLDVIELRKFLNNDFNPFNVSSVKELIDNNVNIIPPIV